MTLDSQFLQERIRDAAANRRFLRIRGAGSKDFLGGALEGEILDTRELCGIVDYEPTELVITAGAGTPLVDLERALAVRGQFFAFEAPRFDDRATLGGVVASGLAGPRRAYSGAVRDFVLGLRMIDGRGDALRFGGQVIKNVAGFDVSRLMAGSMGTLGVLTEITLKTLPCPPADCTLTFAMGQDQALRSLNQWAGRPLPLSASAWFGERLYLRLSGAVAAVRTARLSLGGELLDNANEFWRDLREQRMEFFTSSAELWRLSVPSHTPPQILEGFPLIEWGGALRWLHGPLDEINLLARLGAVGGHAALYRSAADSRRGILTSLTTVMASIHRRLKAVFDPSGIFNRGRLFPDL